MLSRNDTNLFQLSSTSLFWSTCYNSNIFCCNQIQSQSHWHWKVLRGCLLTRIWKVWKISVFRCYGKTWIVPEWKDLEIFSSKICFNILKHTALQPRISLLLLIVTLLSKFNVFPNKWCCQFEPQMQKLLLKKPPCPPFSYAIHNSTFIKG